MLVARRRGAAIPAVLRPYVLQVDGRHAIVVLAEELDRVHTGKCQMRGIRGQEDVARVGQLQDAIDLLLPFKG